MGATTVSLLRSNRYHSLVPFPTIGRLNSRSNLKPVTPGRHRDETVSEPSSSAEEDLELTSYLAALAPDSDLETSGSGPVTGSGSGRMFGEAQVYQLRISLAASQQLRDIAEERGSSAQRLAQEWILERLSWESAQADSQRLHPQHSNQPAAPDPTRAAEFETTEQHFFNHPPIGRL
jgi:hypothetical protein